MFKVQQVERFVIGEPEKIDYVLEEPLLETLEDARKEVSFDGPKPFSY